VAAAAAAAWPAGRAPLVVPVRLQIAYFFVCGSLDVDNMIKPIQDALIGIAYDDDSRVVDVRAILRDQGGQYALANPSAALVAALGGGGDFIHVFVEEADLMTPLP
jgi:crossover junction endodeoxyribonuclease RusA